MEDSAEKIEKALEKIETGEKYKDEGNEFFKSKQYTKALRCYHKGLLYTKGVEGDQFSIPGLFEKKLRQLPDDHVSRFNQLKLNLLNNIAACLLKKEPPAYSKALEHCKNSIEVDKDNVKAWYRMAVCLEGLDKNSEAYEAAQRANRLADGKDAAIVKVLISTKKAVEKDNECFDKLFRNKMKKSLG